MQLPFSDYKFTITERDGKQFIFDRIRKKNIVLTPEEWVRQHLVWYLIEDHGFPATLISVEKKITLHGLTKRTDIVLYNRAAQPVMLIECKAPDIPLSQNTFDQAGRYNLVLRVPYLVVSNGKQFLCAQIDHTLQSFAMLSGLPSAEILLK